MRLRPQTPAARVCGGKWRLTGAGPLRGRGPVLSEIVVTAARIREDTIKPL